MFEVESVTALLWLEIEMHSDALMSPKQIGRKTGQRTKQVPVLIRKTLTNQEEVGLDGASEDNMD